MKKLGQFEIIDRDADTLVCNYVCGLIPNAELFEPLRTATIKSFKIKRRDFERHLLSDMSRLSDFIANRLIHVGCFDVDLTLYDVHTWYKLDKAPQIRNHEAITKTLTTLKKLPMWRSIVITNNNLYNISKRVALGTYDLDEMLGDQFFDKKYTRPDMTNLHQKKFLTGVNDYTWTRDGNKAYPLRCYHAELCKKTAIDREGFLNLRDSTLVIDVVSAFLVDDSPDILVKIKEHGVYPIHAAYTETERDNKNNVVCVQQNDSAGYVEEINDVIENGIAFDKLIEIQPPLYQQQPAQDDGYATKGCCCFKMFRKKRPEQTPLVEKDAQPTNSFTDL